MKLADSFLEELRFRSDIEQIISRYVNLRRNGHTLKGLCPFHNEKTPSFTVYPESQSFYCYGCGAGGEVITFIRKIENLDFMDAVKFLADQAGMQMPDEQSNRDSSRIRERTLAINREAARFFYNTLQQPVGKAGLEYLKNRALTEATIKHFGIGFAPDSWDALLKHMTAQGFSKQELVNANVAMKTRNDSVIDQFRNRIIFPIIDVRGNVIAFGGRVMDDSKPKYLNSSETPVFHKSMNLFALNYAKNENEGRLILAEGYMDVIAMHQAGFRTAVATLGTAITPEQARLMARYANEVIVAYDADEAGQKATNKAIGLLSEAGLTVRVLRIEDGKDPDEFIRKNGPERFKILLDKSGGHVDYKLSKIRANYNLDLDEQRVEFTKEAIGVLAGLDSNIEREVYAGKLSKEVNISKDVLLSEAKKIAERSKKAKFTKDIKRMQQDSAGFYDKVNPEKHKHYRAAQAEEGLIALLAANPDFWDIAKKEIRVEHFLTAFNRRVFEELGNMIQTTGQVDLSSLSSAFSTDEMGRITKILLKNEMQSNSQKEALDYINVIKDEHAKQNVPQSSTMDAADISDYIKTLASKKSGGGSK